MPDTIAQTRAELVNEISSLRLELELVTDPEDRARITAAIDSTGIFLAMVEACFG